VDLDKELSALSEKYRVAVVLCELEGRPRKEVARLLGIAEGTLSSRLATARKMLAKRLSRHGSMLPGVVPGTVPVGLLASTLKAATWVAAGREAAGVISASVLALTEGMVKAMFVNKLKVLVIALVVGGTLGIGTGRLTYSALAQERQTPRLPDPNQRLTKPAEKPGNYASDLQAARDELEQAQLDLQAIKAELERKQAELNARRAHLAEKMAALDRAQANRALGVITADHRALTPQERLSQLERKLVEVLHEVQALRSQMETGQQGKGPVKSTEPRPKGAP
jgi:hypothetical protein